MPHVKRTYFWPVDPETVRGGLAVPERTEDVLHKKPQGVLAAYAAAADADRRKPNPRDITFYRGRILDKDPEDPNFQRVVGTYPTAGPDVLAKRGKSWSSIGESLGKAQWAPWEFVKGLAQQTAANIPRTGMFRNIPETRGTTTTAAGAVGRAVAGGLLPPARGIEQIHPLEAALPGAGMVGSTGARLGASLWGGKVARGIWGVLSPGIRGNLPEPERKVAFNSVRKLTEAINRAKPAVKETEELRTAVRGRQAKAIEAIERGKTPPEWMTEAKQILKGPLPKADIDLQHALTKGEIQSLQNHIITRLPYAFDQLNTSKALMNLLLNKLPARHEVRSLEKAFGTKFANSIMSKLPLKEKAWEELVSVLNLPRAMLAAWDVSAPFRQGIVLVGNRVFWKNIGPMFRALVDEKYARQVEADIMADPNFARYVTNLPEAKRLFFAERGGVGRLLTSREEVFTTKYASLIPGVSASERAYVTFLNKLRFDKMNTVVKGWERGGKKVSQKELEDLAQVVNLLTGRGSLPDAQRLAPLLNAAFFSPRLFTARVMLPFKLFTSSKAVRGELAKDLAGFVGTGTGVLGLLHTTGLGDVNINPKSSDFGKLRLGNARIDYWGGYTQIARFVAQFFTGEKQVTDSRKLVHVDRFDAVLNFLRSKLNPSLGIGVDIKTGSTFMGEEVALNTSSVATEVYSNLVPLFIQDIREAVIEEGLVGALMATPGGVGFGVSNYSSQNMRLSEYVASQNIDATGATVGPESPRRVTNWTRLERGTQGNLESHPEVQEIREDFRREGTWSELQDVKDHRRSQQIERDKLLKAGLLVGPEWVQSYQDDKRQAANQSDVVELLEGHRKNRLNDDEKALAEYYLIQDEYEDPNTGMFDYRGYAEKTDAFLADLETQTALGGGTRRDYVIRQLHPNATEVAEQYEAFRRQLIDVGWHTTYETFPLYKDPEIKRLYDSRLDSDNRRQWEFEHAEHMPAMLYVDKFVEFRRGQIRSKSPDIDAGLGLWKDNVPKTFEAQAIIMQGQTPLFQFSWLKRGETGRLSWEDAMILLDRVGSLEGLRDADFSMLLEAFRAGQPGKPKAITIRRWGLQEQARAILEILPLLVGGADLLGTLPRTAQEALRR